MKTKCQIAPIILQEESILEYSISPKQNSLFVLKENSSYQNTENSKIDHVIQDIKKRSKTVQQEYLQDSQRFFSEFQKNFKIKHKTPKNVKNKIIRKCLVDEFQNKKKINYQQEQSEKEKSTNPSTYKINLKKNFKKNQIFSFRVPSFSNKSIDININRNKQKKQFRRRSNWMQKFKKPFILHNCSQRKTNALLVLKESNFKIQKKQRLRNQKKMFWNMVPLVNKICNEKKSKLICHSIFYKFK